MKLVSSKKDLFWSLLAFVAAALLIEVIFLGNPFTSFAGEGGRAANACAINATSTVAIGPDVSVEVVSAYSQNAYVVVQQPVNASSTVYLNFNADATETSGLQLAPGQASTSPDALIFGRNTDFPFVGSIEALAPTGSTTLFVTECRY